MRLASAVLGSAVLGSAVFGSAVFVAAVFVALLVGCGSSYQAPAEGPPPIASAASEDQACSRDAECVLVQDCCGCARQGRQLAVRRDRVAALQEAAPAECAAASCPVGASEHRSCGTDRARCLGGRCVPVVE